MPAESGSNPRMFGEIAVTKGLVSQDQVHSSLDEQERLRLQGIEKSIGAVMHDKGLLTLVQVSEIMAEAEGATHQQSIEGYEIISKLGEGGMGTVYLGRQVSLNKLVAIKILSPKLAQNQGYLTRFVREAEATARLNHTNIVQALDVGESHGYHYFVMEYVEGETAKEVLLRQGVMEEERCLSIGLQIARALRHAAEHEIIHRDIKPANIILTRDGTAKLCDLGLAIQQKEDGSITRSGVIMGTPYYLSPEQARTEPLDTRSDIYSLGATLYHLATGTVPYDGETAAVILTKHLTEPFPNPLDRNPILSSEFCRSLRRCMEKRVHDRYQNPEEVAEDFKDMHRPHVFGVQPGLIPHPGYSSESRRLSRFALIGVLSTLILLSLGALISADFRQVMTKAISAFRSETTNVVDDQVAASSLLTKVEKDAEAGGEVTRRIVDIFWSINRKYPHTIAGQRARRLAEAAQRAFDEKARDSFQSIISGMQSAESRGDLFRAFEEVANFPQEYIDTDWMQQAKNHQRRLENRIQDAFRNALRVAKDKQEFGDIRGAIDKLGRFHDAPIPSVQSNAAREIQTLKGELDRRPPITDLPSDEATRNQVVKAAMDVLKTVGEGRLDDALRLGERFALDPSFAETLLWLKSLIRDLRGVTNVSHKASTNLRGKVGQKLDITIDSIPRHGTLSRAGPDDIGIDIIELDEGDMGTLSVPVIWIDPPDLLTLAGLDAQSGRGQVMVGILALARNQIDLAQTSLKGAQEQGESVWIYLHLLESAKRGG